MRSNSTFGWRHINTVKMCTPMPNSSNIRKGSSPIRGGVKILTNEGCCGVWTRFERILTRHYLHIKFAKHRKKLWIKIKSNETVKTEISENTVLDVIFCRNVSAILITTFILNLFYLYKKKHQEEERAMGKIIQCKVCWGSWQHDTYLRGLPRTEFLSPESLRWNNHFNFKSIIITIRLTFVVASPQCVEQ